MSENIELGRLGEKVAREYLESERYDIIATNFRSGYTELDIVVRDSFSIRFIEVKSRINHSQDTILNSLSPDKLRTIKKGIYGFLSSHHDLKQLEMFFDVIIVLFDEEGNHTLEHIEDYCRF